jgi:enoyl-CoA hydratase/carnithine racemase
MVTMIEFPKVERERRSRQLVQYRTEGGLAIIELNDPPANAYTLEMLRQLDDAVVRARFEDDVHVIVLRGGGDRFFSAGANIRMMQGASPRYLYHFSLYGNETLNRLEHTPKLTVAALNGHTVGGGLEMALACDLRVAKENGGKIGLPEVTLGVLPGLGGTQRLAKAIGKYGAIELMGKGETFSFERANELGLVNELFPAETFWDDVVLYAQQFCPPHKAARTVGLIKRAVQSGAEAPHDIGQALERELQQQLFESGDAREGIAAFNEKRMPEFTGR